MLRLQQDILRLFE